jgi:hypothetical protein
MDSNLFIPSQVHKQELKLDKNVFRSVENNSLFGENTSCLKYFSPEDANCSTGILIVMT